MCGRFAYWDIPQLALERLDSAPGRPEFSASYNITPGVMTPVVIRTPEGERRTVLMKWGLIPYWAKDPSIGYKTINARAEGIETKASFRKPIRSQRCLVLTNGFYEWLKTGPKGQVKTPYFIGLRDREGFAFAGIYDMWRDPEGHDVWSYGIITTEANELIARIHNRMPVILHAEDEDAWLDPATDLEHVLAMLRPYPASEMRAYAVAPLVNNPRNEGAELIAPGQPGEGGQLSLL